jgi:hypothetical protein
VIPTDKHSGPFGIIRRISSSDPSARWFGELTAIGLMLLEYAATFEVCSFYWLLPRSGHAPSGWDRLGI